MKGRNKRLEVERERERGGRRGAGVQETTGMCRMAGGWPGGRAPGEKVGLRRSKGKADLVD